MSGYQVLAFGLPVPLLHVVGGSGWWDDILTFGGVLAVIGVLVALSWRAGKEKQRIRRRERRRRQG